ncbi:unnamed protein product [Spirodela intermedia]|uniref:Uncharacterized protein n=1 Tax=Spirodela intermedia TaxID=51605 RepID=A0A7I8K4B3_SPIIN|nr:unnamed protein product [Spirodela intermedia]
MAYQLGQLDRRNGWRKGGFPIRGGKVDVGDYQEVGGIARASSEKLKSYTIQSSKIKLKKILFCPLSYNRSRG